MDQQETREAAPWDSAKQQWLDGDLDSAERTLIALATDPSAHTRASAMLIHAVIRRDAYDDYVGAERLLSQAIQIGIEPPWSLARLHRGYIHECTGNLYAARIDYQQLLHAPAHKYVGQCGLYLAWILLDNGERDAALAVIAWVEPSADPLTREWLILARGETHLQNRRLYEARHSFTELLDSDDADIAAHAACQMSLLEYEVGRHAEASLFAADVIDIPEAVALWPFVLEQEQPGTTDDRVHCMQKWLIWSRANQEVPLFFIDAGKRTRLLAIFANDDELSIRIQRRSPDRPSTGAKLQPNQIAALMAMGFRDAPDGDASDGEWMELAHADGSVVAGICESVFTGVLAAPKRFTLQVDWRTEDQLLPQPRPPAPTMVP